MNAAFKLPDWDRALSQSDAVSTASKSGQLVHDIMAQAAAATSMPSLELLFRHRGPDLVQAMTDLAQSGQAAGAKRTLEARLKERGVRQNILDNLELSRLPYRRGMLIVEHIVRNHNPGECSSVVNDAMRGCLLAQWEHYFGLTFLSFVAAGLIAEDAPGVDLMLPWMRTHSTEVYVHAVMADEALRAAA